jgi:hypothetical protein
MLISGIFVDEELKMCSPAVKMPNADLMLKRQATYRTNVAPQPEQQLPSGQTQQMAPPVRHQLPSNENQQAAHPDSPANQQLPSSPNQQQQPLHRQQSEEQVSQQCESPPPAAMPPPVTNFDHFVTATNSAGAAS